jgi:hypothetical protein
MLEVDEHLTWGIASRLDSEPSISASGTAITDVTKAVRTMSWSFIVSNLRELEDIVRYDGERLTRDEYPVKRFYVSFC